MAGTKDDALFQTFRYGNGKLTYSFPAPDGTYKVDLYFSEPWYGIGGGLNCEGWRVFDVNTNDTTHQWHHNGPVDIWQEAKHGRAIRKTVTAIATNGHIDISFPRALTGQSIISAIAISSATEVTPAPGSPLLIAGLKPPSPDNAWSIQSWLDTGTPLYSNHTDLIQTLPSVLYGADWIRTSDTHLEKNHTTSFTITQDADVYVLFDTRITDRPSWLSGYEIPGNEVVSSGTHTYRYTVFRKRFPKGATVMLGDNGHLPDHTERMYSVAVCAATTLEPAVDLRKSAQYTIDQAKATGAAMVRDTVYGKPCLTFIQTAQGNVEWKVSVGVGDKYALKLRYANRSGKNAAARLIMTSADGVVMNDEPLTLSVTAPSKWKTAESSSGSMINAGTYMIKVIIEGEPTISIRDLEVQ